MGRNTDISSAYSVVAIAPSDADDIPGGTLRGFMVGGDGDVSVLMTDATTAVLPGLLVGQIYPFQVRRINATGTTATGIIGLR